MSFIVQAPYPAITDNLLLRSPEFSNQRNKAHTLSTIRTGDGTLYTYIKKKRGREVHQWEFKVSYKKMLEVKEFFRSFISDLVRIYDHNDTVYIGYMTVNPWEGSGEGRAGGWPGNEAYGFTLQLEEKV
jgi:hypothetical protein